MHRIDGKQILLIHPPGTETPPVLTSMGLRVTTAQGPGVALELAGRDEFDMALVDGALPGAATSEVLGRLRRESGIPSILMVVDRAEIPRAIRALAEGADDYLVKPIDRAELLARVGRLLHWQHRDDRALHLSRELTRKYVVGNVVARSAGMRRVRDQILQVAPARSTVLILGESGVGKELVAKAIHYNSPRRAAPFIAINCSAIPVTLIESELFGHERGAFTGAIGRQKGKFELADGGTIFLDEVGEMDLITQAKLLRVLEERSFMRVGGAREVRVDVRVLAATNSDLETSIARRRFREDLYFRLKVLTIRVPPLRARREDIADLARTFLDQIGRENGFGSILLTRRATEALTRYSWPGNVRELKNVLESAAITRSGPAIHTADLPRAIRETLDPQTRRRLGPALRTLADTEKDLLRRALRRCAGNRTHAARALGIGVRTLQRKLKRHRIQAPRRTGRPRGPQRSTVTPSPGRE
jgi:DNA-binding NtrC family response regulator